MPHVTEEIWSNLPERETRLIVAPWPEAAGSDAAVQAEFEPIQTAAEVFRRAGVRPRSSEEQERIFDAVVKPERVKVDGGNVEAEARAAARRDRARRGDARQRALRRERAGGGRRGGAREARALPPRARCARQSDWLESLSPWPEEFGLERMRALLAELGEPQRAFPRDPRRRHERQVDGDAAGGGVPAREGLLAGAYTSPHVAGWSERIQVDGEDADLEQALERVRPAAERLGATQFEVLTAAALAEFAAAEVDVAVVEAGLGGRLDATNVLAAQVVALTNVALDHTDVLGETREAIAEEKLAVVAPGATVVLGEPEWESRARARGGGRGRQCRRRRPRAPPRPSSGRPLDGDVEISLPGRFDAGRRGRLRRRAQPGRGRPGCSSGSRVATT